MANFLRCALLASLMLRVPAIVFQAAADDGTSKQHNFSNKVWQRSANHGFLQVNAVQPGGPTPTQKPAATQRVGSTYVEGTISHARRDWRRSFRKEADVQAACDKRPNCKGYWATKGGVYRMLVDPGVTWKKGKPHRNVVGVWKKSGGSFKEGSVARSVQISRVSFPKTREHVVQAKCKAWKACKGYYAHGGDGRYRMLGRGGRPQWKKGVPHRFVFSVKVKQTAPKVNAPPKALQKQAAPNVKLPPKASQNARAQGYKNGTKMGHDVAKLFWKGYKLGYQEGYKKGHQDAVQAYKKGMHKGLDKGFKKGFRKGPGQPMTK